MSDRRAHVVCFEHTLGAGERACRAPHPALAPLLTRELIGYRHDGVRFGAWLEPPRPEVTLMIDLDGAITADGAPLPSAWIGGLGHTYTRVGVGERYGSIDVCLTPLGAHAVLGVPVSELADACVTLEDAFGAADARTLVGRVREAPGWDARFDAVERFLFARLRDPVHGPADPAIEWAWRTLRVSAGRIRVGALAAELGVSRRYLSARFAVQIGLAPKTVARQLRFAEVRRRVGAGAGAAAGDWGRLAAEVGYADQSHLHRDFRQLAGMTPSQYVARLMPDGGVVGDAL